MEPMKTVPSLLVFFVILESRGVNLRDLFCSPDLDSDSEGSQHSCQSLRSEKTLLEKLEILTNQGLIQVVKIFVDWLRANTDIILMCAQVGDRAPPKSS